MNDMENKNTSSTTNAVSYTHLDVYKRQTIYRYISMFLDMCKKSISDLYDEVKKNNGVVNTKDRKNVTIGCLRLLYKGKYMHILISTEYIRDVFLGEKSSEMSKAG